ncbi:hypothetical protein [Lysobacter sp. A378]
MRKFVSTSSLILVAVGVATAAVGVLFTFPENPLIWHAATWTLVAALAGLLVLVLVSGYVLATDRAARTWQRTTAFLIGFTCLVAIAIGSL